MSTSFFFNNYLYSEEQELIDNLVMESIKIYGVDVLYIPRVLQNKDTLYGEDKQSSKFEAAYPVEMYIRSFDGFTGDGNFLSKFGLEIRKQVGLTVSRRAFESEIGAVTLIQRPREGDLIFFPFNRKLFEIKFTNNEPVFYQMGSLQMYDLTCELYEYSSEYFNTGYPEVDKLYKQYDMSQELTSTMIVSDSESNALTTENSEIIETEGDSLKDVDLGSDNDKIQKEGVEIIDFSEKNPFSENRIY